MMDQQTWQRYIDNTCTPAERKAVVQWLQNIDDVEMEELFSRGWKEKVPAMGTEEAILLNRHLAHLLQPERRKIIAIKWWIAAACILGIAGRLFWLQTSSPADKAIIAATGSREIKNASAHVRKLTLPDGSQIWLSPQSALVIPDDYNKTSRLVSLTGEAYFEITPQSSPFTVQAGGLKTHVLGTHFNVEAYAGENVTSIALTSGKVAVEMNNPNNLILSPGTLLAYKRKEQSFTKRRFAIEKETDWKRGAFVLDDVPLQAAFKRLETRFSKKIICAPTAYPTARFTGTYEQQELEVILKNMAFIHGFRFRTDRDTVFIQ